VNHVHITVYAKRLRRTIPTRGKRGGEALHTVDEIEL